MRTPKVSIGIPTYNRPAELKQCLEDIQAQTFSNFDVLISDNCSTDPGVKRVGEHFASLDPRIRYVRQTENLGAARNFDYVMRETAGEYFIWVSDDDRRSPHFLRELVELLDKDEDAVVAFCGFDARDIAGNVVPYGIDFMKALRAMRERRPILRQIRFFLSAEGGGKPHAIYGLMRRPVLEGCSISGLIGKVGWYGADVLFVAWLMGKGRLTLSTDILMSFTVDTVKLHGNQVVGDPTWRYLKTVGLVLRYAFAHLKVCSPSARPGIFLLMPIKVCEIFFSNLMIPALSKILLALK